MLVYIYIYRSDIADAHLEAMLYITYKTININTNIPVQFYHFIFFVHIK